MFCDSVFHYPLGVFVMFFECGRSDVLWFDGLFLLKQYMYCRYVWCVRVRE